MKSKLHNFSKPLSSLIYKTDNTVGPVPYWIQQVLCPDLFNCQWKIFGKKKKLFSRKFQKAKFEFAACWQVFTQDLHRIYNDLHSTYTVLDMMSNLEMI